MIKDKKRYSNLIAVIGTNNTGKTSVVYEIAKKFKQKVKSEKKKQENFNQLIVYDVQNRFTDLDPVNIELSNKDWAKDLLNYRNSLIILDDYRALIPSDRMSDDFLNLLQYRAEYGLDIILMAHNPALLLERLTYYVDDYFLFYTSGTENSFKGKIPNREQLIKCKKLIDNYTIDLQYLCEKNGLNYGETLFPNFPFIHYTNKKENQAKFVNYKTAKNKINNLLKQKENAHKEN